MNQKELWSVAAHMENGAVVEWIFTNQERAHKCNNKLCEMISEEDIAFSHTDDYGTFLMVNLKMLSSHHFCCLSGQRQRAVDINDTQETIMEEIKHEVFGEPKTGFGR